MDGPRGDCHKPHLKAIDIGVWKWIGERIEYPSLVQSSPKYLDYGQRGWVAVERKKPLLPISIVKPPHLTAIRNELANFLFIADCAAFGSSGSTHFSITRQIELD